MSQLVESARLFATAAHGAVGQKRQYTGEPYILHPMRVVEHVRLCQRTSFEQLAAAWLHDVVEDTKIDLDIIRWEFGHHVGRLVEALTNVPVSAGSRKERFRMNLERLVRADAEAQTIKVADILDNVASIARGNPGYAVIYVPEKLQTIEILDRADPYLRSQARMACQKALEAIQSIVA